MNMKLFALCVLFTALTVIPSQSRVIQNPYLPKSLRQQSECHYVRYDSKCDGTYVQMYLHTRRGSDVVQLTDDRNNITSTYYNDLHPNIIIVHGYNADMNLDAIVAIKDEYLKSGDYNIWMPNFPTLVKEMYCYPFAAMNVPYIARCVSLLVTGLREVFVNSYIHVVGFSLGGEVAGRVGKEFPKQKLDRITGLDPALPLFFTSSSRLGREDAKFVDVVHTNMFIQGQFSPLGHVDFYMNGGSNQPGCTGNVQERVGCDHHRAPMYYAESINSKKGFWGTECSSLFEVMVNRCSTTPPYEKMGADVSLEARGIYYIKTASQSPFALGTPK